MRGTEFLLVFPDAEPEVSYYKSILDLGNSTLDFFWWGVEGADVGISRTGGIDG